MRARALLFPLLGLAFARYVGAENLVMPADLVADAQSHGCEQIERYYDRHGQIAPPYLYEPGENAGSIRPALYWCRKIKPERPAIPYVLRISNPEASRAAAGCPDEIPYWNEPAGLSVERISELNLKGYAEIGDPKRKLAGGTLSGAIEIVSAEDGVETRFVCREGKWHFLIKE